MRINGTNATSLTTPSAATRRSGSSGTFSLSEFESPAQTSTATATRSVAGLDSLLALQGVEDLVEKKKRAVKRGRKALDVLDDLRVDVLSGGSGGPLLSRLIDAAHGLTDETGDPGLDAVLSEIDLRLAVEIAKAGG